MDSVQIISTTVSLITAVVSAVAAVVYTVLTRHLLRETKIMRHGATQPRIVVYLHPQERFINLIDMVVENIGRGCAYDVTWKILATEEILKKYDVRLYKLKLFDKMEIFPPGEKFQFFFGQGTNLFKDGDHIPSFEIEIYFKDEDKRQKSVKYTLNPIQFLGMRKVGTPPEFEIAKSLEAIASSIKYASDFSGGFKSRVTNSHVERQEYSSENPETLREESQ